MEIRIGKSSRRCVVCERPFAHEETFNSLIRTVEQAFVREDYCAQCWNDTRASAAYSVWTPRFNDPQVTEQQPPEVFSPLRQTFYESVEASTRVELAKAFLAAQLLRRQKVFRLIKESEDMEAEARVTLFYDRIGNRLIEVRDPNLSYAELEMGRQALMARLAELEQPDSVGVSEDNE